jgi:hypothetical protein
MDQFLARRQGLGLRRGETATRSRLEFLVFCVREYHRGLNQSRFIYRRLRQRQREWN